MIEFTIQSVQIDQQELQEKLPALLSMINSSLPKKKIPKRRKPRKKKIYLADKIKDIIDSIEE
jgi:hypothetical protein